MNEDNMEVIREYKKPMSRKLVLEIPENLVEEELEILIIPVNVNDKTKTKETAFDKNQLFEGLCGLWEGREGLSLEDIRNKAWKRN